MSVHSAWDMHHLSVHSIHVVDATNLGAVWKRDRGNIHITATIVCDYNCFILLLVIVNLILVIICKLNIVDMSIEWGKPEFIQGSAGYVQSFYRCLGCISPREGGILY